MALSRGSHLSGTITTLHIVPPQAGVRHTMSWILCSLVIMVAFLLPSITSAQAIRFQPQGAPRPVREMRLSPRRTTPRRSILIPD